ncbi:MAG TPA: 4a-hydroxytetrahydrobiopterin dehydratase [Polyangiaceae bacterium]
MTDRTLVSRHCVACEGGVAALSESAILDRLQHLPEWKLLSDGRAIEREFRFENYATTLAFANAVAWLAVRENHHPVLEIHYGHCRVRYTTDAIGGLSDNDFICGAKVDALLEL